MTKHKPTISTHASSSSRPSPLFNILSICSLISGCLLLGYFVLQRSDVEEPEPQINDLPTIQDLNQRSHRGINQGSSSKPVAEERRPKDLLTTEQRADNAWRALREIPLDQLIPAQRSSRSPQSHDVGLLGSSISHWRSEGLREGFTVVEGASRPTLHNGPVSVVLRVREGIILGAEVSFAQNRAISAGPEWSRVIMLVVGSSAFGGSNDPMMMLDQLSDPQRVRSPSSSRSLSGVWGVKADQVHVEYYLTLNDQDAPLKARIWVTPLP